MTTKVTSSVLANTSVVAGTYGGASIIPIITIDGQGRITSATGATVSGGGGGSGTTTYDVTKFTATAGQTVFNVNYTVGYVQVFVNGVLLDYATEFTAANGTSITLTTPAALNDIVTVYAYSVTSVSNINGGAAGVVLYQAAANTTSNTDVGTTGHLLTSAGAGKPYWSAQTSLSIANTQITGLITDTQLSANSVGYNLNSYVTPGTWTKPAGLKSIKVTVVAGGGAGGSSGSTYASSGGSGGAGGASVEYIPAPSIPGPVAVTVGTGGVANGGAGNSSSFGAFLSATGGGGGGSGSSGSGGAGGTGSGGSFNVTGGAGWGGGYGFQPGGYARYGGMSGGSSIFGGGGLGGNSSAGGNGNLGGGGGAGQNIQPAASNGGNGGDGIVIVEEFY